MIEDIIIEKRPIKGIPLYGDWLRLLLVRKAARECHNSHCGSKHHTGGHIVPFNRDDEQTVEQDRMICLGCGMPAVFMELSKIKIGAVIQFPDLKQIEPHLIEKGWKVQPVSKSGMGCRECAGKMMRAESETGHLNYIRSIAATAKARDKVLVKQTLSNARCDKHRLPYCAVCNKFPPSMVPTRLPSQLIAFIDVGGEMNV